MDLPAAGVWALWLGVLTSLHPCPLAGNVAALSFIVSRGGGTRRTLLAGSLFGLGRMLAYAAVAAVLAWGAASVPAVAHFLQAYLNKLLGPVLVLAGMVVLGLLGRRGSSVREGGALLRRARRGGMLWCAALGAALALSFCPVSAALFFGALLPLSLEARDVVVLPLLYGAGTAAPVVLLAATAAGAARLGRTVDRLRHFEPLARAVTGFLLIALGVYSALAHIFQVV